MLSNTSGTGASRLLLVGAAALVAVFAAACGHGSKGQLQFESVVAPIGHVHVTGIDGLVELRLDPTATHVEGTVDVWSAGFSSQAKADQAIEDVTILESGDEEDLHLTVSMAGIVGGRIGADVRLNIPPNVTVSAETLAGAVFALELPVTDITSEAGSVELQDTFGPTMVRTADGAVTFDHHQGGVDARTRNGEMVLRGVFGNVRATTSNAPITATVEPDIPGEVYLTTSNAPVDVALPWDFGAELFASTAGGQVIVQGLDLWVDYEAPGQLEGAIGSGWDGYVDVRTTNAPITLSDW